MPALLPKYLSNYWLVFITHSCPSPGHPPFSPEFLPPPPSMSRCRQPHGFPSALHRTARMIFWKQSWYHGRMQTLNWHPSSYWTEPRSLVRQESLTLHNRPRPSSLTSTQIPLLHEAFLHTCAHARTHTHTHTRHVVVAPKARMLVLPVARGALTRFSTKDTYSHSLGDISEAPVGTRPHRPSDRGGQPRRGHRGLLCEGAFGTRRICKHAVYAEGGAPCTF